MPVRDQCAGERARLAVATFFLALTLVAPATAAGATGDIAQLSGAAGCVVDTSRQANGCTPARALDGPGPFLGSRAVAVSPDGKNVYVASSTSDSVAVFRRKANTGALTQAAGTAGCVADGGAEGCAAGAGLDGPNSVAVSPDGDHVYATAENSSSIAAFSRDPSNGALTQIGCVAAAASAGCAAGRALDGADVVVVSPDGENVYVGAFKGNAIAAFARNGATGALTQPAGAAGCIAEQPGAGCAPGIALLAPEGLAINDDGASVYAAAAASNAVAVLVRDPATGALSQASDGSGCIVDGGRADCAAGRWLEGANAVAVSPDDDNAYVTSLFSNSVTSFARSTAGQLSQLEGTAGCVVYRLAVGCGLGEALEAPEGLALSPDGVSLYTTAFESGAVDVFKRKGSGALRQRPGDEGCVAIKITANCTPGRRLVGVSSIAVSPDGESAYATAFGSDAVAVFERATD